MWEVMCVIAKEVLAEVVKRSGKSPVAVSREMGRADSYLSTTMGRGSVPRLDIFVEVCRACGYEVIVRNREGKEILVEIE